MDFEKYIDDVSKNIDFTSNSLIDIGNGILLTNKEIEVLKYYNIPYTNCKNLRQIIFLIENAKDEYDEPCELLDISYTISERDYYINTKK